jgi:prevent-host-death family protein
MLATITVEEAQLNLKDLIDQVAAGQEIIITRNQQPVARLVSELPKKKPRLRPPPGLGKGMMTIISDDDEHLKDFAEYMP